MRRKDEFFVDLIKEKGVPQTASEKREIAEAVWPSLEDWNTNAIVKKVNQKLRQPDIKLALGEAFFEVSGFTPAEALSLHIQHIRGFKRKVMDGNGKIQQIQDRPNYQALKDYEQLVIGGPEKRIRVDSRNVNVNLDGEQAAQSLRREGPPPTRARTLTAGEYRIPRPTEEDMDRISPLEYVDEGETDDE